MWCEQCQSDVASEISADGQQLLCTTCHQPVRKVVAPSLHPETRSAREFLERWAREQQGLNAETREDSPASTQPPDDPASLSQNEPIAPVAATSEESSAQEKPIQKHPQSEAVDSPEEPVPPISRKNFRLDAQHDAPSGPIPTHRDRPRRPHHLERVAAPASAPVPLETNKPHATEETPQEHRTPRTYRLDEQETIAQGPHYDVGTNAPQKTVYPGRSEAMWGQLLAYAGVGLLTMGTVFVLWGYFGELEQYASTGWLMSTAGQMLLLLGIVTLVGGGMQQTTHEVSQRIEHLGGRIIRIEQSTDKILKGPQFKRSRRRSRNKSNGEQDAA